jgi:phosphohistidine phosphatase
MRLTLLRHGLAEPSSAEGDYSRQLLPRGREQACQAGLALKDLALPPDQVLSSPAARALQTARCVMDQLALTPERLQLESRLYLATSDTLLELLDQYGAAKAHLLIVGHNPGLSELALQLGNPPLTGELATGEWLTFDEVKR